MKDKKRVAFNKMIHSINDFSNITKYSNEFIDDEIYFEYPTNVFWSVLKSGETFRVYLYPEHTGGINELIELFEECEFGEYNKQPRTVNFMDVAIGDETKILYESLKDKSDGLDDLYDTIISF